MKYMTVTAIAALLGVRRRRAYQLVDTPGFPAPVDVDTGGLRPLKIYAREEVAAWIAANR